MSLDAPLPATTAYPRSLKGKVALVVGGAGAIGAATSRMLADAGAAVVVTHWRPSATRPPPPRWSRSSGTGHRPRSPTSPTPPRSSRCATRIAARHGRLDILVNAAGFTKPVPHGDLDALDDELHRPHVPGQLARPVRDDPHLRADAQGERRRAGGVALLHRRLHRGRLLDRLLRRQGRDRRDDQVARPRAGARGAGAGGLAGRGGHGLRAGPRGRFQRQGGGHDAARRASAGPRTSPPRSSPAPRCSATRPDTPSRSTAAGPCRRDDDAPALAQGHPHLRRHRQPHPPEQTPHLPVTPEQIADSALDAARPAPPSCTSMCETRQTGRPSMELDLYRDVRRAHPRPERRGDRQPHHRPRRALRARPRTTRRWRPRHHADGARTAGRARRAPAAGHLHARPQHHELRAARWSSTRRGNVRRMARVIGEAGVRPEIELFDSGDIALLHDLLADGTLNGPVLCSFVMGVRYGFQPSPETVLYARGLLPADAQFTAIGIGRASFPMVALSYLAGGHVRVGLEDACLSRPRACSRPPTRRWSRRPAASSTIWAARSPLPLKPARFWGCQAEPSASSPTLPDQEESRHDRSHPRRREGPRHRPSPPRVRGAGARPAPRPARC